MKAAIRATPETAVGLLQIVNARVTYRNAPMHLLEKFTFRDLDEAHRVFLERAGFEECIILQTCNRVEVFGVTKEPNKDSSLTSGYLQ